ncbi:chromate transporter [Geomicrobium sediminis]|uniref:Chromate transporter n=1 Tax=Geomicrobium sediminis TaxID=1347788 RepID=A0ABS2PGP3_9BACL|nr:chromate transporter [Geomicrobium sediminis]MBM7634116.1 chromate transporter [Geomicrobium sediminis]GAJ98332.1 LOW QUALITY PROTEIN: chromate transporter [Geomicrobium sp. JCM 19055]
MNAQTQLNIFIAMFRANILGYGGGPPTIPLVHKEVVDKYKWMSDEEFSDAVALGNTLPGPIITKLCGYIGYQIGGTLGLINAIIAAIMPTAILTIILVGTLSSFRDIPFVQGMTYAIAPVVGVLLIIMTYNFLKQSNKKAGFLGTVLLTFISLIVLEWLNVHPAILIVTLIAIALIRKPKEEKQQERGDH